jgi:hypothetical protein
MEACPAYAAECGSVGYMAASAAAGTSEGQHAASTHVACGASAEALQLRPAPVQLAACFPRHRTQPEHICAPPTA